ncbi:MAG: hypothetical protein J5I47_13735 [Vicingus serpentipes]|nr:hypothetical protein [Vicingus serpentipes]
MKKILFVLGAVLILSQLFVSCSADNEILSQFSKRKYLKKYKSENARYEDNIGERDNIVFKQRKPEVITVSSGEDLTFQEIDYDVEKIEEIKYTTKTNKMSSEIKKVTVDYSNWNSYNRDFSRLPMSKENVKYNNLKKSGNMTDLQLVLAIILLLFIPPISVLLSNSDKFVLNLILYLAGLLLWIAGVSATSGAMVGIGSLLVFVSFIHALVVLIKNA